MSHKTILSGLAAAAVGLTMFGGVLPATAASPTTFAPTSHSHHSNKCWDVNFYKHRGHWHVTWRDSDGKHNERAKSFRGAVDELKDQCDRFSNHRGDDNDRDNHDRHDSDRDDREHRDDHDKGDNDHKGDHRDDHKGDHKGDWKDNKH
jgi:hypothetical protein